MEEKQKKMLGFIFAGIILVGVVLAIVGMFIGVINESALGMSESMGLFDEGWDAFEKMEPAASALGITLPSRTFMLIAFIVLIVGGVLLLVKTALALFAKKNIKVLGIVASAVTLVGAVLVLVAGIILVGQFEDTGKLSGGVSGIAMEFSMGAGVYLGFIGGLLAGAMGIVGSLKAFAD